MLLSVISFPLRKYSIIKFPFFTSISNVQKCPVITHLPPSLSPKVTRISPLLYYHCPCPILLLIVSIHCLQIAWKEDYINTILLFSDSDNKICPNQASFISETHFFSAAPGHSSASGVNFLVSVHLGPGGDKYDI